MISETFKKTKDSLFAQNQEKKLYFDQFEYMIKQLNSEHKDLSDKKIRLMKKGFKLFSNPDLKKIQRRIDGNRAEAAILHQIPVSLHNFFFEINF